MKPRFSPALRHLAHVAAAAAVAGVLGWLGTNQAQVLAAVPARYQAFALTTLAIVAALYKQPPGQAK